MNMQNLLPSIVISTPKQSSSTSDSVMVNYLDGAQVDSNCFNTCVHNIEESLTLSPKAFALRNLPSSVK